ncbi:hypothetical protein [Leptospira kmetyi]|uniref:hypothetical protein n=1 Tax=Leptospira kmetyi TaxID=408139 RepID=UPI003EC09986
MKDHARNQKEHRLAVAKRRDGFVCACLIQSAVRNDLFETFALSFCSLRTRGIAGFEIFSRTLELDEDQNAQKEQFSLLI